MVGSNGLGPSTSRLSGVCSNQLSYEPIIGGGKRDRTDDPLLAGQVLYQLSYTPIKNVYKRRQSTTLSRFIIIMHRFTRCTLILKTNEKETIMFLYRLG